MRGEVTETTILTTPTVGTTGRRTWWGPTVTGKDPEEDVVAEGVEEGILEDQKLRSFPMAPSLPFWQGQLWLFTFFTPR